jgi:fatty acid synthase
MILLCLDSPNGFGVISAKFEDISIVNNPSADFIYSFIDSRIKMGVVKPLPFTIYPYSDIESAFR